MFRKLKRRFEHLVASKARATYRIWTTNRPTISFLSSPDHEAKSIINSVLLQRLSPSSEQHKRVLDATADEILNKLKNPQEISISERMERNLWGAFHQSFWFHGQLSGLTATWEFQVRLLGIKLGITPNIPIEKKSKGNRTKKSVQHRTLTETIKEIHKVTGHRLNLRLTELAGLRDAIVHCNPQGMKAYAEPIFGKNYLQNVRGDVVVMQMNNSEIQNLSDLTDEKKIEEQDLFGWFIEVFNSGLPKKAFDKFDESIRLIDLLIAFAAISFGEREKLFTKLAIEGKKLTPEEMATYSNELDKPHIPNRMNSEEFFNEIMKCFKNLS